jgi:hypothetical protein
VEFSPALSLRAKVVNVRLNGKPVAFRMQPNSNDQHLYVRFPVGSGPNNLVVRLSNDFGLTLSNELPALGSASRGLRVTHESWDASRSQLTLDVSGVSGSRYELGVWNSAQIATVEGAVLSKFGKLEIEMPKGAADAYVPHKIVIHFRRS